VGRRKLVHCIGTAELFCKCLIGPTEIAFLDVAHSALLYVPDCMSVQHPMSTRQVVAHSVHIGMVWLRYIIHSLDVTPSNLMCDDEAQ
jgi:hypothetical protein